LGKQGSKVQKPNDCVAGFLVLLHHSADLDCVAGLKGTVGRGETWPRTKGYFRREYGEQMEIDLRLPYKRLKQIYPYSKITYQEQKQLQMRNAFRVQ